MPIPCGFVGKLTNMHVYSEPSRNKGNWYELISWNDPLAVSGVCAPRNRVTTQAWTWQQAEVYLNARETNNDLVVGKAI